MDNWAGSSPEAPPRPVGPTMVAQVEADQCDAVAVRPPDSGVRRYGFRTIEDIDGGLLSDAASPRRVRRQICETRGPIGSM